MTDYMDIIYKYEKQGIPYRNRYDDIRGIVTKIILNFVKRLLMDISF